jgi:O-antigen/teichoic acid export membrane protein
MTSDGDPTISSGPVPIPIVPPAETHSKLHRRLTINSLSNLLRYSVSIVLSFLLTPFVVRTLGDALYGFWVVLLSFVGYAGIMEFGVQSAVVKLVGQHRLASNPEKLSRLLGAAFVFFSLIGIVSALFFAGVLPFLLPHIAKNAPAALSSRLLFAVIAIDILIIFQNSFLTGILFGWQLYPAKNLVDISSWVVNAILLFALLKSGDIFFLACVKTATDLGAFLITLWVVRATLPGFRLNVRAARPETVRELLGFGGRLFVSATTTRIAAYAHPLVVSARISTAATAFFSIPVRLVEYAREIGWSLATGFMPAFSELEAQNQTGLLRSIYLRYSKYLLVATMPIYVLLIVYGGDFIGIWIGPDYGKQAAWPVRLIALAALIENLQPLYWRLFIGVGKLDVPVMISASASLASVIVGYILAPQLGITGPALAICITMGLAQILFTVHVSRYLQLPVSKLVGLVSIRPLLTGILIGMLGLLLEHTVGGGTLPAIILGVLVCLLAYAVLAVLIVLESSERTWLRLRASMLRKSLPGR